MRHRRAGDLKWEVTDSHAGVGEHGPMCGRGTGGHVAELAYPISRKDVT